MKRLVSRCLVVAGAAATVALALSCSSKEAPPQTRDAAIAKAPPPPRPKADAVKVSTYPTAAKAVQAILSTRPRVVGFGEYHATIGGAPVVPSLTRFRTEILPQIAGFLSDVVVETYVEPSGCGKKAQATAANIKKDMQRPEETETEVFALLREARERKLGAHILEMSCKDYESLRSAGQVDYQKTLGIITSRLRAAIDKGLAKESRAAIAVYGGTMHNDLHPNEMFADFSYAFGDEGIAKKTRYVEIDLFVPELIENSKLFEGEAWFEIAKREASSEHVVVIPRGPASFVVLLRSGVTLKASP